MFLPQRHNALEFIRCFFTACREKAEHYILTKPKMLIWAGGGKWGSPKTRLINLPKLLSIYQFVRGP